MPTHIHERDITIDDKTKIPLFIAISAASYAVFITAWLVTLSAVAHSNKSVNETQDIKLEAIYSIKEDVAVIKQILKERERR